MQKIRNQSMAIFIVAILLLSAATLLVTLPTATAHDPGWKVPTWCFITVSPNPVGVGQNALVVLWVDKLPPTAIGYYGDRWTLSAEVTKPDGTTESLGTHTSDPVGSTYIPYTPTETGTYKFVASFQEHKITGEPVPPKGTTVYSPETVNDTYLASTSEPYYLTVQQDPIPSWQETPLPTDYWARPISAINRDWWTMSGDWLGGTAMQGQINPYSLGPQSAHIMWTKPLTLGGLTGGKTESIGYYDGLSYEPKFTDAFIIQGRLYYNDYPDIRYNHDSPPPGMHCIDMRTGQEIFAKNYTISLGQDLDYETFNQHGVVSYIWKIPVSRDTNKNWYMYDAFNGVDLDILTNVPTGTDATGKDGSLLRYVLDTSHHWLALWNATDACLLPSYTSGQANYNETWRTGYKRTIDARTSGYTWNTTIPQSITGSINWQIAEDKLIGSDGFSSNNRVPSSNPSTMWALSLKPGEIGKVLWQKTYTPPTNESVYLDSYNAAEGIFTMLSLETDNVWCYSLDTGSQLWGPVNTKNQMDYYGLSTSIVYGKVFTYGYGGVLTAYNAQTGAYLWNYTAKNIGFESPYGNYPLNLGCIADGKLYMYSTEHSPTKPQWRGSMIRAINASNGAELWTIESWANNPIIADGYLITLNTYDNQIYCYGKGPSVTSVTASPEVSNFGDRVLIKGNVLDNSAGTKQDQISARFPHGVPAMSDQDQKAWMECLYEDQPTPTNATGVLVTINVVDSNGNYRPIGTAMSDSNGVFSLSWKPDISGDYAVIAAFEGSEAYYPSHAETAFTVSEANPTPTQSQSQIASMTDTYFIPAIIGLFVFVAIIGAVLILLMIRKRP